MVRNKSYINNYFEWTKFKSVYEAKLQNKEMRIKQGKLTSSILSEHFLTTYFPKQNVYIL